jgi:hypothetical protein
LARGYVDGAMSDFRAAVARQVADIRRQQIAAIRVKGVVVGQDVGHVVVDRDPGSLEDSAAHICRLAGLLSPDRIEGRSFIVSVSQPGYPQAVVGRLVC